MRCVRARTHKLRKVKARPVRTMCTYGSLRAYFTVDAALYFVRLHAPRGYNPTAIYRLPREIQLYGFSRIKIKVHTDTVHPAPR